MLQPVSRIVDLLDPSSEPYRQHERRGGPRRRVLDWRSRRRARHRRLVRARGRRGRDRPARAVARSPDALLPGQAARGPGALRRRPHRHAACRARPRRPGGSVPPELHAHGPRPLRRRDRARRLSRSGSRSIRVSSRRRPTRCPRRSTRSAASMSARWRTRSRSGCGRSKRAPPGASPSASRSPGASTAARSFSSPITR